MNTRERAEQLGLIVMFDCLIDIGWIMGDERRLRQVMFNLIANALKFTPPKGEIRLSASKQADEIVLVVEDTGIGIDFPKLDKVFEPFERAHSMRAVGAGLGLPLVCSFIELHGGRVELDSVPGRGTKVTCHLPLGAVPIGVSAAPGH